tara:strand:- start:1627 stop:1842 length:216 start_codon:yes stop_codon:yes gene_type:complete
MAYAVGLGKSRLPLFGDLYFHSILQDSFVFLLMGGIPSLWAGKLRDIQVITGDLGLPKNYKTYLLPRFRVP